MCLSQVKHADRKIVRVLPAFRLCIFPEALHATFDEGAMRVFERPEFFQHVGQTNGSDALAVERIHAVRGNGGVFVIGGVEFERNTE